MAADGIHVVVVHNRFEKLAVLLAAEAERLVADTANEIEADMKAGTSPRIARTIRSKASNNGRKATITAGDKKAAIHAGFVEYGTRDNPAQPFATPAAESHRRGFIAGMRKLLDRGL